MVPSASVVRSVSQPRPGKRTLSRPKRVSPYELTFSWQAPNQGPIPDRPSVSPVIGRFSVQCSCRRPAEQLLCRFAYFRFPPRIPPLPWLRIASFLPPRRDRRDPYPVVMALKDNFFRPFLGLSSGLRQWPTKPFFGRIDVQFRDSASS